MNKIIINDQLQFSYADLYCDVDFKKEFTLLDVLRACVASKIPLKVLSQIVQCNNIKKLFEEADNKKDKNKDDAIEYLEVFWMGSIHSKMECVSGFEFYGVGKEGVYGEDIAEFIPFEERKTYREHYALEYSKLYNISHLVIKVSPKMHIRDHTKKYQKEKVIDFIPSVTLIDLLSCIFDELAWFGSIGERDNNLKDLKKIVYSIKKGRNKLCHVQDAQKEEKSLKRKWNKKNKRKSR